MLFLQSREFSLGGCIGGITSTLPSVLKVDNYIYNYLMAFEWIGGWVVEVQEMLFLKGL